MTERLRREHRNEQRAGFFVDEATREADERLARGQTGPPPTDAESAMLADSPHQRAELFCAVLAANLATGEQERFTIVPDGEGDPAQGRVSIGSPIGRALFSEYPGSVVTANTPGGPLQYRILRVER